MSACPKCLHTHVAGDAVALSRFAGVTGFRTSDGEIHKTREDAQAWLCGRRSVRVGSTWKRNAPGSEVVRIERVWLYGHPVAEPTVRAHPTTGGRPIVAPIAWLREHYTERVNPPGRSS